MTKYVLIGDSSLSSIYRNFPLLDFLPSAPSYAVPKVIYNFLKGPSLPAHPDGTVKIAPYSIRKLQAALLARNKRNDVAVAHEDHLANFIKDDTEVIAVSTMDPLGLGPLAMSYYALLGAKGGEPWVKLEWQNLIAKINALRKGKKAKLLIGGPGVWEFTILPEELDKERIDYAFQGEADDIICDLFEQVANDRIDHNLFFDGFVTMDDNLHRTHVRHPKFLSRSQQIGTMVPLTKIPPIVEPAVKGMVETMRGCGIGCNFCEVTLRPLRYYPLEKITQEINVNSRAGYTQAWLHADEFFAYKHAGPTFEPNKEALLELFKAAMSVKGIQKTNPTHARISPAAAYPDLLRELSKIARAGPSNWLGCQVGIETGSDRLAKRHMPNKTLPLRIGVDGSWKDIVWQGTVHMTKYYWRPAFTVQVGQREETDEDSWDTVELINKMSNSYINGRSLEFTITPMQNVPLGLIKSKGFSNNELTPAQFAVYYTSYRHLYKIALRNARKDSKGGALVKNGTASILALGAWGMMKFIEHLARKCGLDIDKAKRWGVDGPTKKIEVAEEKILNR